jgi:hypothetical protein
MDLALLARLNAGSAQDRLLALESAVEAADFPPMDPRFVNNHIHTTYSFSPYSPSAAVFAARGEGLCTAGIIDHDSIAGAREFLAAGRLVGLPVTVGIEARLNMRDTPFARRTLNNPDQQGIAYVALHAVPHRHIQTVQDYFAPFRAHRNQRNRAMVARIAQISGLDLDFDRDVLPLSQFHDGGSVTERHLMLALARAEDPERDMLAEYDRVGELKKQFIPKVYIPADAECPDFADFVDFSRSVDGILAYSYLGDVTQSPTGDKRPQLFEDDYLDELMQFLWDSGIRAITYMPTRNTDQQLRRLRRLCEGYDMMQISGEDINSPRQRFVIEKLKDPQFDNLIQSTWDLIKHENGGEIP